MDDRDCSWGNRTTGILNGSPQGSRRRIWQACSKAFG
jgi:hypothetical protein